MACNAFICTILFDLSESSKIAFFNDLVERIIEAKVVFYALFRDFDLNYPQVKTFKYDKLR